MRKRLILILSAIALSTGLVGGCASGKPIDLGSTEVREYQGQNLSSINDFRENSIQGPQYIDIKTYQLKVTGLVGNPQSLSYDEVIKENQLYKKVVTLDCVEGWNFTAKWTGPTLSAIFNDSKVKPEAKIAIFHTVDVPQGYSSLDLSYIYDSNIIIALKDNDITLSADRGFPFQVVAMSKFGYKWAKWVTRIELSSDTSFRGYWESYGL